MVSTPRKEGGGGGLSGRFWRRKVAVSPAPPPASAPAPEETEMSSGGGVFNERSSIAEAARRQKEEREKQHQQGEAAGEKSVEGGDEGEDPETPKKQVRTVTTTVMYSSCNYFLLYFQFPPSKKERQKWSNPIEFLLSCVAMSVGLGERTSILHFEDTPEISDYLRQRVEIPLHRVRERRRGLPAPLHHRPPRHREAVVFPRIG